MFSNNFAMMIRVRGDVSVEQMTVALEKIRSRHPLLIPVTGSGQGTFTNETPFPLRSTPPLLIPATASANETPFPLSVRTDCNDSDWIEVAQTELRESFAGPPAPFARFTMLRRAESFDLVAAFDHAVSDGVSGMFVLRDILQALGDPQAQLTPIPTPPQMGALIPQAVLRSSKLRRKIGLALALVQAQVLLEKTRRRFSPRKQVNVSQTPVTSAGNLPAEQQFVILPKTLTASQTATLVARCKEEQVSVHAAICAAWLRANAVELKGKKSLLKTVSSPVNLRERLSASVGDTSGLFLTIMETSVDCAPEKSLWDIARAFKEKFTRDLSDESLFFMPLLFTKIFTEIPPSDHDILIKIFFSGPVKYDFSITNLGRILIPERSGTLQVEAFYGPLVNSSEQELTVGVSTLSGQMSISFLFRKSKMEPAAGQALMNRAIALLTTMLP